MRIESAAGLACLHVAVAATSYAQTASTPVYPSKPVRIIIPFAPGGPTDTQARWAAQQLTVAFSQPVISDNRPGAGGVPGSEAVVKSAPDGYILLAGNPGPLTIAPTVKAQMPYDTLRDLMPIVLIAKSASCICTHPSLPVNGVKEFVAFAKARPGRINYGTPGIGTVGHLATESFAAAAGVKLNHVPYKGAAQFTVDLLAGNIEVAQIQLAGSVPLAKQGKVRCLGVTSIERTPLLPNVPTIAEQGLKGFQSYNWNGLLAPAATPKSVITRIHKVISKALKTPEARELYNMQGHEVSGANPDEYAAFIKAETAKWAQVAQKAGISKQ